LLAVSIAITVLFHDLTIYMQVKLANWSENHIPLDQNTDPWKFAYWLVVLPLTLFLGLLGGHLLNFMQGVVSMKIEDWATLAARGIKTRKLNPLFYINFIQEKSTKAPLGRALDRMNADFEIILFRAVYNQQPVCFTLKSGKVYVGSVQGAVDPTDSRDMIRILPQMSGYRNATTHKIKFTTFYRDIYTQLETDSNLSHLNRDRFEVAFGFQDVQSVNIFDYAAYNKFQTPPSKDAQIPLDLNSK